jgi:putative transposase
MTDDSAMTLLSNIILYLVVRERRPNRSNPTGRINAWKSILNTLAITYGDPLNIN